jgi:hypothetical protein
MPQFSDDLYLGPAATYMGTDAFLAYNSSAATVTLVSGSSSTGFAVGDTLQVLGGTGTPAVLTVSTVSGGAVTGLTLTSGGAYSNPPLGTLNTAILTSSGGGGTLPTVSLTYNTAQQASPAPMSGGVGPLGRVYVFDACPAAPSTTALAAAQATTTSSAMTLSVGSGTGVTKTLNTAGQTIYALDYARAITITTGGSTITASVFTVSGYDIYGQAMTEAISVPTTASTTTTGNKAFKVVVSITPSVSNTNTVSAGISNTYGLPVRVTDVAYIASVKWAQTLASNAGTFVAAAQGTASSTTGDVRGTFTPTSNANGTYRLVMAILLPAIAVGPNATVTGALGVTQA